MNQFNPIILSEDTILLTHSVLTNGKLPYDDVKINMELTDAIDIVVNAYNERTLSTKHYWYYKAMVETLFDQFSTESPEVMVLFIRNITDHDVMITYNEFPFFRDVVKSYGPLLRAARQVRIH